MIFSRKERGHDQGINWQRRFKHTTVACRHFLLSLCLIFYASQSHASDKVSLSVTPIACIVSTIGEPCNLTVTAHWQAKQPKTLCLYQLEHPVQCWSNKRQGSKRFTIKIVASTQFKLVDTHQVTVASVQIIINAANPTRYRRRLRADWSVF